MKLLILSLGMILSSFSSSSYGAVLKVKGQPSILYREESETVQVQTENGIVEGAIETTKKNKPFGSFRGIPFAEPPVGPLRFKDPVPPVPWNGVLPTIEQKPECVQPSGNTSSGSEDCLYLNVYTPDIGPALLPVFVYVHGGAFITGASTENPETIVEEDFVTVMITYRLGVLGFLSLGTSDVPGNAGIKDVVLALKWVQQNIRNFGGDPDNVSILGLSAGSAIVSHLHVSPMAKGLFHKVIAASGTTLCDWAVQKRPEDMVSKLANLLNLDDKNLEEFVENLRGLPAYDVANNGILVEANPGGFYEDLTFVPVVEKIFDDVEPFFVKSPLEYIKNGEINDVPTIMGQTSKEYIYFYKEDTLAKFINDDLIIVPDRWRLTATDEEVEQMAYLIREHYFGKQDVDVSEPEVVISGIELLGDIMFAQPIIETAGVFAQYSKSPVYHYRFSYRGEFTEQHPLVQGAGHVSDIQYLFRNESQIEIDDYSSAGWVRRRFIKVISNFAKTGNPTPGPENTLLPFVWKPVRPDQANYLEIDGDSTPSENADDYRTRFWRDLEEKWRNGQLK